MTVDELTDDAFFELYKKNPQIKVLVDDIQRKYNVHASQKGQSGYNEGNIPIAFKEAKETVQQLLTQQQEVEQATKTAQTEKGTSPAKKPSGPFGFPILTKTQAAFGLATIVVGLFALSSLGAAAPVATAVYNTAYMAPAYMI